MNLAATPTMITASTDRMAAPAVTIGTMPYDVGLDAMNKSYVKVVLAAPAGFTINAGTAGVLTGTYFADTAERTLPIAEALPKCPTVVLQHFHLEEQPAGTYYFELNAGTSRLKLLFAEGHEE